MRCGSIILAALLSASALAQIVVLHDGRIEGDHYAGYRAINVTTTNHVREYYEREAVYSLSRYGRWALADLDHRISASITGTVEQAEADLNTLRVAVFPTAAAVIDNALFVEALGGAAEGEDITSREALRNLAETNRASRSTMRPEARSVKTNVAAVIKSVKASRQSTTGLVDAVKGAQVGTNANTGAVRTGHRFLTDAVETLVKEHRATQADVAEMGKQLRILADIVRRSALRDEPKTDEETGD